MEVQQPKRVQITKLPNHQDQKFLGKYFHLPLSYNKDVYVNETIDTNIVRILYYYNDKDNEDLGSWRLTTAEVINIEESLRSTVDLSSPDCGAGFYYIYHKRDVSTKFNNFIVDQELEMFFLN